MLEWVLLLIGFAGFGSAAWLDLKTTEFPDWIPYAMIAGALASRGVYSFAVSDFSFVTSSAIIGLLFLGLGMAMYWTRQWGDGAAWLLGAMGFLFADSTGFSAVQAGAAGMAALPFPLTLVFNFFFISFFYLIAYSIALGAMNPRVTRDFAKFLKGSSAKIVSFVAAFCAMCAGLVLYSHFQLGIPLQRLTYAALFPVLFACLLIFVYYGKFIEGRLFRKRVDARKLRPGDVPADRVWKVLSEKDVAALRKKGGRIWIKEGVRFAPVFIITLILTLLFGNVVLLAMGI